MNGTNIPVRHKISNYRYKDNFRKPTLTKMYCVYPLLYGLIMFTKNSNPLRCKGNVKLYDEMFKFEDHFTNHKL